MGVRDPLWARVNPHTEAKPVIDVTIYSEAEYNDTKCTHDGFSSRGKRMGASAGRAMGRNDHLRRSESSIHNPFRTQRQNAHGLLREWRHPRIFHGGQL